jgi:pimeloyl-ACP methyl ester carboxylesterase
MHRSGSTARRTRAAGAMARRSLRAVCAVIVIAASVLAVDAPSTWARPSGTVDELVPVDGARLHVRCVGQGKTTVLLIAGFEDLGGNWAKIEPPLADKARVCSYDRFGDGTSDPPPRAQTFASAARGLRALLRSIKEPGPYVVVGHSFGGSEAATFAKLYPKDVRGLLLLDASPVDWPQTLCGVPDDGSEVARTLQGLCASVNDPAKNKEHLDGSSAFAKVARIHSLGKLPLVVATAAEHAYPGLAPEVAAHLADVWARGQKHWASLSASSKLISVANTGHLIQLDQPHVVIQQIEHLLGHR